MKYQVHMVTIEEVVPQEHILSKVKAALDLSFVYEETTQLYSRRCGRPPIDPVVMVKYLLIGFPYGIQSERKIEQRIQTDVAFRWYLGLDLLDRVPDHSTISKLRRRKPTFRKVFRRLSEEVVGRVKSCAPVHRAWAGKWKACADRLDPHQSKRLICLRGGA